MEAPNKSHPDVFERHHKGWDAAADYDQRFQDKNHRAIFADSGYSNYGYWDEKTKDAVQACDTLVDKLIDTFPDKTGNVLDVACGCGGSTKRLSLCFKPKNITAINISRYQVESTQAKVPESRCLQMDAVKLEFEADSFDNILCVEAACCFRSRLKFFKDAYRVLKPGGRMALTDILIDTPEGMVKLLDHVTDIEEIPLVNRVNAEVYRDMLEVIGFKNIKMVGVLKNTIKSFENYSIGWVTYYWNKSDEINAQNMLMYGRFVTEIMKAEAEVKDYIIVSMEK